jgi:hypothetical protein
LIRLFWLLLIKTLSKWRLWKSKSWLNLRSTKAWYLSLLESTKWIILLLLLHLSLREWII